MRALPFFLLAAAAAAAQVEAPEPVPIPPAVLVDEAPAPVRTDVEAAVEARIAGPGVHVVHFWAPWCGNSRAEFERGWYEVVDAHPEVTFSFVTVWSDGDPAADRLARYGIAPGPNVFVDGQPDFGPSADPEQRRRTFLGLPLSWTPSTWVFNRAGRLAYAFNYGEVTPAQLAQAIDDATDEWHHD